ncbi:MAG: hypothetical protein JWO36_1178 [Myxococcales bacterium]|nr:hypothetical protein [Myxococcales bacterium]
MDSRLLQMERENEEGITVEIRKRSGLKPSSRAPAVHITSTVRIDEKVTDDRVRK